MAQGRMIALAPPEELRRMALGGEVIQLETAQGMDGAMLSGVPGVIEVRQSTPRRLQVTVEDAGAATPRLLEQVAAMNVEVVSSSEYRPSFDEVFAALVAGETQAVDGEDRGGRDTRAVPRAA
jgi:hypothetical protein